MSSVRICIDVSNLDAASAFYCEALECTEVGRSAGSVRLTAGGNDLYLLLRDVSGDWGSLTRCVDPFGNGFCLLTN